MSVLEFLLVTRPRTFSDSFGSFWIEATGPTDSPVHQATLSFFHDVKCSLNSAWNKHQHRPHLLLPHYSRCGLQNSNTSTAKEIVRNAEFQAHPMSLNQSPQFYKIPTFIIHDKYYHFHKATLFFYIFPKYSFTLTVVHVPKTLWM